VVERDELSALALIGSCAAWGTTHALLSLKNARPAARWRGALSLLVPPLALYLALRAGHRAWAAAWTVTLVAAVAARVWLSR